jgi:hypothetical protein
MGLLCRLIRMPRRSRTPPQDENQAARRVVDRIIERTEGDAMPVAPVKKRRKNPGAVALGRKGGKVGGRARADSMTPEERTDSARKAAAARWASKREKA